MRLVRLLPSLCLFIAGAFADEDEPPSYTAAYQIPPSRDISTVGSPHQDVPFRYNLVFEVTQSAHKYQEIKVIARKLLMSVFQLKIHHGHLVLLCKILGSTDVATLCNEPIAPTSHVVWRVARDVCGVFADDIHTPRAPEDLQRSLFLLYAFTELHPIIANEDKFFDLDLTKVSYLVNTIVWARYPESRAIQLLPLSSNPLSLLSRPSSTDQADRDVKDIGLHLRVLDIAVQEALESKPPSDQNMLEAKASLLLGGRRSQKPSLVMDTDLHFYLTRLHNHMRFFPYSGNNHATRSRFESLLLRHKRVMSSYPASTRDERAEYIRLQLLSLMWNMLAIAPKLRYKDLYESHKSSCNTLKGQLSIGKCQGFLEAFHTHLLLYKTNIPKTVRNRATRELVGAWDGQDGLVGFKRAMHKVASTVHIDTEFVRVLLGIFSILATLQSTPTDALYKDRGEVRVLWIETVGSRMAGMCGVHPVLRQAAAMESCDTIIRLLDTWRSIVTCPKTSEGEVNHSYLHKSLTKYLNGSALVKEGKDAIQALLKDLFRNTEWLQLVKGFVRTVPGMLGDSGSDHPLVTRVSALVISLDRPQDLPSPRDLQTGCMQWRKAADKDPLFREANGWMGKAVSLEGIIRRYGFRVSENGEGAVLDALEDGMYVAGAKVERILQHYPMRYFAGHQTSSKADLKDYTVARSEFFSYLFTLVQASLCSADKVLSPKGSARGLSYARKWLPHAAWLGKWITDWDVSGTTDFPPLVPRKGTHSGNARSH